MSIMSHPAPSQYFEQATNNGQLEGQTVPVHTDPSHAPPPPPAPQRTSHAQSPAVTGNVVGVATPGVHALAAPAAAVDGTNGGMTNETATAFRGTGEGSSQPTGAPLTGYTAATGTGSSPPPPPPPPPPPLPGNPSEASPEGSSGFGGYGRGVAVAGELVGAVASQQPLRAGSAEPQTADARNRGGGMDAARWYPAGAPEQGGGFEGEDEDERALRIALEEEHRYFEGQEDGSGVDVEEESDASFDGRARHGAGAPAANVGAGAGGAPPGGSRVPPGKPLTRVAGEAKVWVETSVGGDNVGGDSVGGGDGREVEVDEDLARVLEQSRLEAEAQVSLRAEGEEEMMARVMEESRQEQERRNMEHLELQRVRGGSDWRFFLSSFAFM